MNMLTYLLCFRGQINSILNHYRDFDVDAASLNGSIDNMERGSLASFGSGTTTDSDNHKVGQLI